MRLLFLRPSSGKNFHSYVERVLIISNVKFSYQTQKIRQIRFFLQKAKLAPNTSAQHAKLRRKREFRLAMQIGFMSTFVLSVSVAVMIMFSI